ncbi:MAG: Ig-like domain-containing protein [Muribaculaceae bacterium]|nr:Ig-like domain-containing protein [Muribaculaceae bacterium]
MNRFLNKYLFLIAGILFSVFPAIGNNVISLSGVQGEPGSEVTVKVSLNSTEAISALQITAPLEDAASAITESGKVLNRAAGHSISCGTKDGNLNLMIYSTGMNTIAAGSGEVAEFKLKLGELPMSVSPVVAVKATDANGKEISCQAENWTINVSGALAEYPRGVAYDFGRVPLRDSYTISIPVRNNGGSQLVISNLEFSAPEFTVISSLPFKVDAGNTSNLEIGYSPVERGPVTESVKLISNSYSPNNVLKLLADPFAVNEIHIQNVTGTSDSEVEIVVAMNNMDKITGFTLEFDLPSQLEYVDDSFVLSDRKTDHVVSASYTDSKLKATAYSLSNAGFKEEEGKLASFKVKLKGRNSTSLKPSKAVLSALIKDRVEDVTSAVYAGQITVQYPYLYASNSLSLGRTPITEAISVPLRVNNYGSAPLIIERAIVEGIDLSMKNDFPIEISSGSNTDIILNLDGKNEGVLKGTLQLYSNDPENRMFNVTLSGERYAPNSLSLTGENVLNTLEKGILTVSLDNYDVISGFQFDVTYPAGFEPQEPVITERTQGFNVNFSKMGNNVVRYICYSLSGVYLTSGTGDVFDLPFSFSSDIAEGAYQFIMSNVKLSTPEGVNKSSVIDTPGAFLTIVPYVAVESISLDKTEYEGEVNSTVSLKATITPDNATEKTVNWTSSDNSVATVDDDGLVSLLSVGKVVLTATCEGKTATCDITVIPAPVPVQSIYLDAESIEMFTGDQVTLTATVYPEDATDKSVEWSSSNESVATVSEEGEVVALSVGKAIITARCGDVSATCEVTVQKSSGLERLFANPDNSLSVYTTDGILIKRDCKVEELKTLHKGIYIIVSGKDRYKISI